MIKVDLGPGTNCYMADPVPLSSCVAKMFIHIPQHTVLYISPVLYLYITIYMLLIYTLVIRNY